jgi:UrcA family protein
MFKPVLITAFVATFGLAGVNATAVQAQTDDAVKVMVSYSDINTATPAGAKTLRKRIERAAEKVCGGRPSARLQQTTQFTPCVNDVTAKALASLPVAQQVAVVGRTAIAASAN